MLGINRTTFKYFWMCLIMSIAVQMSSAAEADTLSIYRVGINYGTFNHSDYPDYNSQKLRVSAETILNRYVSAKFSISSVTFKNTSLEEESSWRSPDDFTSWTMGAQLRDNEITMTPVFEISLMVRDTGNRTHGILLGAGIEVRIFPSILLETRYSTVTYGLNPVEGSVIKTLSGIQVGLNYQLRSKL